MRLLSFQSDGSLTWTEFSQDKIPPYGILSHRWESEEVTFVDLIEGCAESKAGYRKIEFCGEQALRDKLEYFWVDSCCIDKRNYTELTKAINSMFRWYRNAVKCYVYLSDVHGAGFRRSVWEADFRNSRWFTRGWTLQELLAPACVEFYSSQGQWLGNKDTLVQIIHEITEIPISALRGEPLDTFSIEERMAWAANRQTSEEEDGAYCLLGIFNIFIPLIYGEGKNGALRRLHAELDGLSTTASNCFTVPFERNPRFTGRESLLADVESKLFVGEQTAKIAIIGLGGIGKTQIALELAYRTRSRYKNCSVFWIPVTDMDSFHQAYQDIAHQLQIPGCDEEKADVKKLVQTYLSQETTRPWLCIFDNADDVSTWVPKEGGLKEYIPKSKQGCVVFTTRNKKVAVMLAGPNIIEVPELDEDGGVQLLQRSLFDPSLTNVQQDAKALLKELNYLPLAIAQGAAYINKNSITLRDYLSLLNEQEGDVIELLSEEFEDDYRYPSIKNPVVTTWLISFEQIRRRDPLAADYLSFMACIDRKDIPKPLLPAGESRKAEVEAIGTLRAYSFIVQRSEEMMFDLHRLVHLASRNWLRKDGTLSRWSQAAIEQLSIHFPEVEYQNRIQWRILQPHTAYALQAGAVERTDFRRLHLISKYAKSLFRDGRYEEAEKSFQEVYETRISTLGDEDPDSDTLTFMAWLASTYRNQGRWQEAEELQLRVMETRIRIYGEERIETLVSMNDLAVTYEQQDRWKEAEELGIRAMKTQAKLLGEEHEYTLTSMYNLAVGYKRQGRIKEAEDLFIRGMEAEVRVLGADHPNTLKSMNSLAIVWKEQGRYTEAIKLLDECVQSRTRVLGANHPETIGATERLARWTGRLEDQ